MGGVWCLSAVGRHWGCPGVAEHEPVQDGQDVLAVLAGGVDVAADVEPVLGGVFAGEPAGDLLLGLLGADSAFADVVGLHRRMRMMRVMRRIRLGFG